MPRKSAVVDLSVEEQREIASSDLPIAKAVTSKSHTVQVSGRQAAFGELETAKANGRPQDPRYDAAVSVKLHQVELTGLTPATVLNFLPIKLTVNSPMQPLRIQIPPAYGTKEYTSHTWNELHFETLYVGEGVNQPREFHPIELALAYEAEYHVQGGVVAFMGTLDDIEGNTELLERIKVAKEKSYAWMRSKVEEGNAEWNSPNRQNARNITSLHRDCAQKLFDLKLLPSLPEWIQTIRKPEDIPTSCKQCGATPDQNAVRCVKCGYIIDPAKAFEIGAINEEDESLERLTRAQVEQLGISAYVAETCDERAERLKVGAPKPLSVAAQRAFAAQQEYDKQNSK